MPSTGIFYRPQVPLEEADIALLGLPWDGTVSNRAGTRFGPEAIRSATLGIEDYSPYQDRDISRLNIHDAGDPELPFGDTQACLRMISEEYAAVASVKKTVALGGEHLVSWPLIRFMHERYGGDLFVLQLDAHADLREQYLGVRHSHATVMNLAAELIGHENMAAAGIRSGTPDEWKLLRSNPRYFGGARGRPMEDFESFARGLENRKVYLTVDVDVFDPGVMPGTGTPEPGGISFPEFVRLIRALRGVEIVGADIVELAPDYDHSGISQALAGTALREILLLMGGK
ncbi:MAG: agmatinase [Candidatus Latescibacterota bacterium]